MDGPALSSDGCPRARGGSALAGARRTTRSLVLWSGGIDSSYTLLRLLADTVDEVLSHHVVVGSGEGDDPPARRGFLEAAAIERLQPAIVARTRAFEHTRSWLDAGAGQGVDGALLAFLAARVARARDFTPFDRLVVGVNADEDPGWDPESCACALRRARLARALRAAWGCDEVPQIYFVDPRPAKATMVETLGPRLTALTVSCVRPLAPPSEGSDVHACGTCAKCRARARYVPPHARGSAGPPPAAPAPSRPSVGLRELLAAGSLAAET